MYKYFVVTFALFAALTSLSAESPSFVSIQEMLVASAATGDVLNVEHLNDHNFDEKIAKGAAIVDYYTTWCGPCQNFAPIFAKVAKTKEGSVSFYKVDIEQATKTAGKNKIRAIPTIVLYYNGQEVARNVGFLNETALLKFISDHINH